jgi:hypothetical protein
MIYHIYREEKKRLPPGPNVVVFEASVVASGGVRDLSEARQRAANKREQKQNGVKTSQP